MSDSDGKLKLPSWIEGTGLACIYCRKAYLEGFNAGCEATAASVKAQLDNATERIAGLLDKIDSLQSQLAARGSGKVKKVP